MAFLSKSLITVCIIRKRKKESPFLSHSIGVVFSLFNAWISKYSLHLFHGVAFLLNDNDILLCCTLACKFGGGGTCNLFYLAG